SGDSANDLVHTALDPNVHIMEAKAATCGIKPGRRPRGKGLTEFVAEIREQAQSRRAQEPRVEPEEARKT
ncbi:MAG: hypothetical protein ACRDV3_07240, partial [Acidothermaceae bacterium]